MPLTPRHRQELVAIVALLIGVFVGLALLPTGLTGPAGRGAGRFLWTYLGAGAGLIPILGVTVALAGFGRLPALDLRRAAILFAGLIPLVPFAMALGAGIRSGNDFPPDYVQWTVQQRLVGIIPGMVAVGVTSVVGLGGAVIVGLVGLSALTLVTLDWHPFRRLTAGEKATRKPEEHGDHETAPAIIPPPADDWRGPDRVEEEEEDLPQPPPRKKRATKAAKPAPVVVSPTGQIESDELPPLDLLAEPSRESVDAGEAELDKMGETLIQTLATFKVEGKIVGRTTGPVVTQFEIAPAPGVKVQRIAALSDDLALTMRAQSIRIVAPIPGKAAVGVEVPNPTPRMVTLRELIEGDDWDRSRATLPVALGRDLEGKTVIADLARMPHLLIAGATGSGKSVCINTLITSLIYHYTPKELKMLMIDPKMVELSTYNALPHMRHPVVTNNKQAAQLLKWAVHEMERRYELFHANTVRNIHEFNRKLADGKDLIEQLPPKPTLADGDGNPSGPPVALKYTAGIIPYLVIIVDELADLMMTVQGEVETPLALLAQKARATGIHIVLATQRPSVNVITGLIKANFSSRIAFRVASKVDSRTILDQNGAEALLGNGDMLFLPPGKSEPVRLQGAFIATDETERVTDWYKARKAAQEEAIRAQGLIPTDASEEDPLEWARKQEMKDKGGGDEGEGGTAPGERDALFREAAETCIQHQLGSTSLLQRKLRIGYGRAARVIDQLHEAGILGPPDGSKPREVLIGMDQIDEYSH
ncbi:MAG: DNA translocase FtsK [Gemmatimonadetes bacterium]|nr:DNA translocase FtsK [Gemmatimonadota bacterium]